MKEYIINAKKYRLNVFDKLDDTSSYLIGYLCGDGIFNQPTHKRLARMGVSSNNREVIDWIVTTFTPDSTIDSRIPVNTTRNIVSTTLSHKITMSSKFADVFKKYGVLSLKPDRTCVGVSKVLFPNYLKGLIDSDGCFSSGKRKDRDRVWMNFQITHQSTSVLTSVQRYLHEELNLSSFVNKRKEENCYDLKMSNTASVLALINWLLETDTCPFYKKYQADKCLELSN